MTAPINATIPAVSVYQMATNSGLSSAQYVAYKAAPRPALASPQERRPTPAASARPATVL